ncbi:MAG: CBS domain-containing protein [Clostridia bacterium]|nr:CBS domain-containing protein [Clostridia bacterium]
MKAREIMSPEVITIGRETTIEEIAHILSEKNISGVPVVDEGKKVIGMVTQKDLLYKDVEPRFPAVVEILGGLVFLKGVRHYNEELKKLVATKAEDIMTKNVVTVNGDIQVERVAELMIEKDINRIPVVDQGTLVGIISRADIVKYIAKMME